MFIYEKYDSESCFYFGLSEKEKYQILYEDYLEEIEREKERSVTILLNISLWSSIAPSVNFNFLAMT